MNNNVEQSTINLLRSYLASGKIIIGEGSFAEVIFINLTNEEMDGLLLTTSEKPPTTDSLKVEQVGNLVEDALEDVFADFLRNKREALCY